MNEITLKTDGFSIAELSEELGTAAPVKGPSIPTLKINSAGEDAQGVQIPLGAFFLNSGGERVYAKDNVKFRAFSNHIQYQHWGDRKLINKSLLVVNQRQEARDQLGGVMCGVPTYEESIAMTPDQRKELDGRDRYRIVRGLISYTGKTAAGKEVTIENQPVVLSLKRKNYGPFYHDVIKKMPTDSNLWDFECILDTEKFKTDKGAVYYVMRFKPQLDNMLMMDQVIYDSLLAVKELVNSENSRIEDSYKQAHMGKAEDALMDNASEVLGELETDFA